MGCKPGLYRTTLVARQVARLAGAACGATTVAIRGVVTGRGAGYRDALLGRCFTVTHAIAVEGDLQQVRQAFTQPATWWISQHPWAGQGSNLSADVQAG